MKKGWVLTKEQFDTLLDWLDLDRERAGHKYETIRLRLIKIFTSRGCPEAEELADETINRVASKLSEIIDKWEGDPALYFFKVAQYVLAEWRPKANPRELKQDPVVMPIDPEENDDTPEYECLLRCLEVLRMSERTLVVNYYEQQGHAKIKQHQQMATALGIAINALRIRACRIRRTLRECVQKCVAARKQRNEFNL